MLTKEKCERALENAVDTGIIRKDWNVLNQLIQEHFELVDKYYKLESENIGLKQTIANFKEKQEKFFKNI